MQDPEKFEREYRAAIEPPPAVVREPRTQAAVPTEAGPVGDPEEFTTVGKGGKSTSYTSDAILKVLGQVNESRGKKVTIFNLKCCSVLILYDRIPIVESRFEF